MNTKRKATMFRYTEEDQAILDELKRYYGTTSTNEVLRMALRAALRETSSSLLEASDSLISPCVNAGVLRSNG